MNQARDGFDSHTEADISHVFIYYVNMDEKGLIMPSDPVGFFTTLVGITNRLYCHYISCGQRNMDEGLKKTLRSLAEQERNHIRILDEMTKELQADPSLCREISGNHRFPEIELSGADRVEPVTAERIFSGPVEYVKTVCELLLIGAEAVSDPDTGYLLRSLSEEEKKHIQWMNDRRDLENLGR